MDNKTHTPFWLWNERESVCSPEVLLWREVIRKGIKGALKGNRVQMERDWNWFFGEQDYWNCFENICNLTGQSSERIRAGIVIAFIRMMAIESGSKSLSYRKEIYKKFNDKFVKYWRKNGYTGVCAEQD